MEVEVSAATILALDTHDLVVISANKRKLIYPQLIRFDLNQCDGVILIEVDRICQFKFWPYFGRDCPVVERKANWEDALDARGKLDAPDTQVLKLLACHGW